MMPVSSQESPNPKIFQRWLFLADKSASLLAGFPVLGDRAGSPFLATYDADLIPFPFDEEVGMMLDEAFGEDRMFHKRFGYHADIVRPKVAETFPSGWENRLTPLGGVEGALCLDPHDMAAAKCLLRRDKDRVQLRYLVHLGGSSYDFPGWLVLPLERFGHGSIVVFDEIEDLRV